MSEQTVTVTLYNKSGAGPTVNAAIRDAYAKTTKTDRVRPGANYGFHPADSVIAKWWLVNTKEGKITCTMTKEVVGTIGRLEAPSTPTHVILVKLPTSNVAVGPYTDFDTAAGDRSRITIGTDVHSADAEIVTLYNIDQVLEKLKDQDPE